MISRLSREFIRERYRATTVVDYLDLEFQTLQPTPAYRLQTKHGGQFSYVTGLDPRTGKKITKTGAQGKNTPTTAFRARIQDPARCAEIKSIVAGIKGIDPSSPVRITGIEVSFDLYARPGASQNDLLEMTMYFVCHSNRVANSSPRFYRFRKETHYPATQREILAGLLEGFCAGFGNRDDNAYQRIYFKRWDNKKVLPETAYRARHEIRLSGNACPVCSLDELSSFDFSKLAKFFKYKEIDHSVSGLMGKILQRRITNGGVVDQNGELTASFRNKGRKRKTPMYTVASDLNEVARDQLKKLNKRWLAPAGRGIRAHKLCANNDRFPGSLDVYRATSKQRDARRATRQQATAATGCSALPSHAQIGGPIQAKARPSNN